MVIFCTYLLCGDVHFSFGILCAFLHYRIFCDMVFNQLYSSPSCGYTIFFTLDWRKVWISNIFNWNTGKGPGVVQKSDSEWKMNIPYFPSPYSLRVATINNLGFPGGASGKEPTCQCRRHKRLRSDPWVGKIPWRGKRQPTPVFLPGESPWTEEPGGLQSMGSQGRTQLKRLSTQAQFLYINVKSSFIYS